VAPEATIMAAHLDPLLDDHIIWAVREIFNAAGNRPAVVNLSLGGHHGPHDGTSAIEDVIATETGPGRIVVVAAGNEGDDDIHRQVTLQAGQQARIPVIMSTAGLWVDAWISRADTVNVWLEDPAGTVIPDDGQIHTVAGGTAAGVLTFLQDSVNRDQNLHARLIGPAQAVWNVVIDAQAVMHSEVHAWGGNLDGSRARNVFQGAAGPTHTVGMPGTEERAICVGSVVSHPPPGTNIGDLSSFSSRGPTRVGLQKPDIVAPGELVLAALGQGSAYASDPQLANRRHPTLPYIQLEGTSMAAPFMTGLIALMLERESNLEPNEIKQRLRATGRIDTQTGPVWNEGYGFGRTDASELLDY